MLPFRLASRVAVSFVLQLPTCTENDAPVDPPGTVTEDGTERGALLASLIATVNPPLGDAADSVTLQTLDACEMSTVGLHTRPLTVGGAEGGGGGAGAN